MVTVPADPTIIGFLLLGLLGGAHCLGMCGPLVTMYADRLEADGVAWPAIRQHGLFNLGRTLSYAVIGTMMGAIGASVFEAARVAAIADSVRATAGILVGGVILIAGVRYALGRPGHLEGRSVPFIGGLFSRVQHGLVDRVDTWVDGPRIVGLGAIHGVLPCPLLYPAFLYAFSTGSPVDGGLALGALGVGTFPTLFAYGTAFGTLDAGTRSRLHRGLGVVFLALGTIPLVRGLGLVGIAIPHPLVHG